MFINDNNKKDHNTFRVQTFPPKFKTKKIRKRILKHIFR